MIRVNTGMKAIGSVNICLVPLATQLFKLLDKYRPETKEAKKAKKERLKQRAVAKAEGKVRFRLYLAT